VLVPLLSLDARTRGLKGAAIATDRLSLRSSIIHAFEENSRDFSQPLLFIYKIHLFPFTHPLAERILAIIYFSQESTYQKETTRAIFKSRVHHLFTDPAREQRLLENMEGGVAYENDLNLKETELRLGLPGTGCTNEKGVSGARNNKRPFPETREEGGANGKSDAQHDDQETASAPK